MVHEPLSLWVLLDPHDVQQLEMLPGSKHASGSSHLCRPLQPDWEARRGFMGNSSFNDGFCIDDGI